MHTSIKSEIDTATAELIQKINLIEMTDTKLKERVNKVQKATNYLHQTVEQVQA